VRSALPVERASKSVERLQHFRPLRARQAFHQHRKRLPRLLRYRVRSSFAARGETHVGLAPILRTLFARNETGALEPGEIAARSRRVDPQHHGEGRGRYRTSFTDELERFCLLRGDLSRARALTADSPESSGDDLNRTREPFAFGHGSCNLQLHGPRQACG